MKNQNPNIRTIINDVVPGHIVANYPRLIEFAKAYFDFLEKSNKAGFYTNALPQQRSIYTQQDEFLQFIQRELGIFVPRIYSADPKVFYDKISELWRSKGSQEAIETFFLLFLDDVVEIYYPWNAVLIPSDGRWVKEDILRVSMKSGDPRKFVGKKIRQVSSEASAIVERAERKVFSDGVIWELTLVPGTTVRSFDAQQDIVLDDDPTVLGEIYRSITGFNILNRGTGYKVGDRITIQGFDGFTFVAYVSAVSLTGEILDIEITNFGSGNTPIHIRIGNVDKPIPDEYYLKDFILYQYLDDQRSGLEPDWTNNLITETTPFTLDVNIGPGITETSTTFSQDYFVNNDLYYAEDYFGESVNETQVINALPGDDVFRRTVINIQSDTGTGADLQLRFGAVTGYPGRYLGVRGQLSESIVLQDSFYYQKYSYEVNTVHATRDWINQLTRAVHPAGTKVFGNVKLFNKLASSVKSAEVFILQDIAPRVFAIEEVCVKQFVLGVVQDYIEPLYFAEDYFGETVFNETINAECQNSSSTSNTAGSSSGLL